MLIHISEHQPELGVRFRLAGQMWQPNFCRVVLVNDSRVLINDEDMNKLSSVELDNVIQFEVDERFQAFEPHNHYNVVLF